MSELPEIALTKEEIDRLLHSCNGRALLVGGQSLAFWAQYYQIRPQGVLADGVTRDAVFIGTAAVAREVYESLRPLGWRFWSVSFDDATAQIAKLSKRVEGEGIKQIDFLSGIVGLDTESIRRRSVTLRLTDGSTLLVLHPLDVLESRLRNIASLPSKRDPQGIAQARLAIEIVGSYLQQLLEEGQNRLLLNAIERVATIAQQRSLEFVFHDYDLDPLTAVPVQRISIEEFRNRRWPQITAHIDEQRRAYEQRRLKLDPSGESSPSP